MMDEDLEDFDREALISEIERLRAGIREHRDSFGHELCWHHPELWGLLLVMFDASSRRATCDTAAGQEPGHQHSEEAERHHGRAERCFRYGQAHDIFHSDDPSTHGITRRA